MLLPPFCGQQRCPSGKLRLGRDESLPQNRVGITIPLEIPTGAYLTPDGVRSGLLLPPDSKIPDLLRLFLCHIPTDQKEGEGIRAGKLSTRSPQGLPAPGPAFGACLCHSTEIHTTKLQSSLEVVGVWCNHQLKRCVGMRASHPRLQGWG